MNKENKESKKNLESLKNEVASELGINLKAENLTAKEAGKVGGEMTKELVEKAKEQFK